MILHLVISFLVVLLLAFELNSVRAALLIGTEIAGPNGAKNIQDAVTPPLGAALGMLAQLSFLGCIVVGFVIHGWLIGLLFIPGLFLAVGIARKLYPAPSGAFFRNLIVRSMMNRLANFQKSGDVMRARAMKDLLRRLGYQLPSAPEGSLPRNIESKPMPALSTQDSAANSQIFSDDLVRDILAGKPTVTIDGFNYIVGQASLRQISSVKMPIARTDGHRSTLYVGREIPFPKELRELIELRDRERT